MEINGQLHDPATFDPQGKSTRYPLDRMLGGPQKWSAHGDEEKNCVIAPSGN